MRRVSGQVIGGPNSAAEWFAARRAGSSDPTVEQAFERWLAADPERQRQYALCEIAWDLAGPAAAALPRTVPALPSRARMRLARWGVGLGLAASLLLAVVALRVGFPGHSAPLTYATGPGEQQVVMLTDGSRVTLNTRTSIEVDISSGVRQVLLKQGEAFFDVTHDERHPFRVVTSLGEVRVLGTRFAVYQRSQSLEVSTEKGLVEVQSSSSRDPKSSVLVPTGSSAVIPAAGRRPEVRRADLERIRNWRRKLLEFDAVPLADLLEEFSRYTPVPIHTADAELGALRVSGVFHIGDTAALSQALRSAFGLVMRRSGSGQLIVERQAIGRPSTSAL